MLEAVVVVIPIVVLATTSPKDKTRFFALPKDKDKSSR